MTSSFNNYLSSTNYLLGTVLGAGDVSMNKTNKKSCPRSSLWILHYSKGSRLHNILEVLWRQKTEQGKECLIKFNVGRGQGNEMSEIFSVAVNSNLKT